MTKHRRLLTASVAVVALGLLLSAGPDHPAGDDSTGGRSWASAPTGR
jgi:hypothetical protein